MLSLSSFPFSQVYILALDTLQWSILDPHPVGFRAPSVHGHTAVEDPLAPGRLIVFGGRGGTHWNTEVLCGAAQTADKTGRWWAGGEGGVIKATLTFTRP